MVMYKPRMLSCACLHVCNRSVHLVHYSALSVVESEISKALNFEESAEAKTGLNKGHFNFHERN